jgi:hypothetical protein
MDKINIYETYRKVKQRIKRCTGPRKTLAELAAQAAKDILQTPTLTSVAKFRKLESKWLLLSNKNSTPIAEEFYNAIQANNFEIKKTYSSHKTDWNPKIGYLYCFASKDYPGIVKIGATTSSVDRRLNEYKTRRRLNHLKVVIAIRTKNPSLKERKIHGLLKQYKVYPETISKSNEWFKVSQKFAKALIEKNS